MGSRPLWAVSDDSLKRGASAAAPPTPKCDVVAVGCKRSRLGEQGTDGFRRELSQWRETAHAKTTSVPFAPCGRLPVRYAPRSTPMLTKRHPTCQPGGADQFSVAWGGGATATPTRDGLQAGRAQRAHQNQRCRERAPSRSPARNATEGVPYRHITGFVCQNPLGWGRDRASPTNSEESSLVGLAGLDPPYINQSLPPSNCNRTVPFSTSFVLMCFPGP